MDDSIDRSRQREDVGGNGKVRRGDRAMGRVGRIGRGSVVVSDGGGVEDDVRLAV